MVEVMLPRTGPVRSAGASLWLGIVGVILVAGGAIGSGQGLWPFTLGLLMVVAGLLLGVIGGLTGLIAALRNRGGGGQGRRIIIGLLLSLATLLAVGPWIYRGVANPPIHDVTTDLSNPPLFSVIPPRKDNLAGVGSVDAWRALHAKAYSDIRPITLDKSPIEAMAIAAQLATARGWAITPTAPDRVEATATVSLFKFKDDVVIVATPAADGTSTLINMRSVSRVGQGDFGLNAKRIRAFLADLEAAGRKRG